MLLRWLRQRVKRNTKAIPQQAMQVQCARFLRHLWIEPLEERLAPATAIWDGGAGATPFWSDPANWVGDVAPMPDDNLVFPTGVAVGLTNSNDFAAGTRFRSITVSDSGYNISGNSLILLEGFIFNGTASGAQFTAPITLGAAQTFYSANQGASITLGDVNVANLQTLTVDGRGDLNITGVVSGTGAITKLGDGSLILAGDNSSYMGIVTVTQGAVNAQSDNALGSATAGTIVNQGAVLLVQGDGLNIPEPFSINLYGVGFDLNRLGAIRNVSGDNTLSGNIALAGATATGTGIGVDAGTLTVTGSISEAPGSLAADPQFFKFGEGTLVLAGSTDNNLNATVNVLQGVLALNKSGSARPFFGNLVIGDNRDGVTSPATVQLLADDQIPEINFFGVGVNTVTINSNGTLDLGAFNDTIGSLAMVTGGSSGAVAQSTTGVLTLLGDITVTNFQGSSGAVDVGNPDTLLTSAALIKGFLDLGSSFSGAGGLVQRTINVSDTALPNPAADLVISAVISGAASPSLPDGMQLTKAGGGTLRLTGNNTYVGVTRLTAGFTEIGSDTAFGNSSLVAISAGFITAQGGARTVDRPISVDGSFTVTGVNSLTFTSTKQTLLTSSRTISILDPAQVTTFQSGFSEGLFAGVVPGAILTKTGKGELNIQGPSTFAGALVIGSATTDGGTVRFSGNGALPNNLSVITVQNGQLILDNSAVANSDRITDQASITLNQGKITLIGNATTNVNETLGSVTVTNTGTIESQAPSASPTTSTELNLWQITAAAGSSVAYVGTNVALSENGLNQIDILQAPAGLGLVNNIIPNAVVLGPGNAADLATYAGGANGFAVIPLPPEGYVNSFDAANPTSNVKITSGVVNIDSRTINALVLGPGVTVNGNGALTTLTVSNGPIVFDGTATLAVPYINPNIAQPVIFTDASGTGTISGILVGNTTVTNMIKAGTGTLALTGANQFNATLNSTQGVLAISNASSLGSPAGVTTINYGSQLQISGGITVLAEPLTVLGLGLPTATGAGATDGAIYNVSGDNQWSGGITFTNTGISTTDATLLFPNSGLTLLNATAINVASGTTLTLTNATGANTTDLLKLGAGTLELSGISSTAALANAPRIKQGTLFLNRAAGLQALSNAGTWTIGDDIPGNTATLKLGQNDQIPSGATLQIASNGTFDMNGKNNQITNLTLEVGPLGGSTILTGGGTLTLLTTATTTVHALGGGNPTGASIDATGTAGTLALNGFNLAGVTRTFTVNNAAVGSDLIIKAAIVDGSLNPSAVTKSGLGALEYQGSTANTYTGTTTVNEGALLLNKSAGTLALSGALAIGDNNIQSGGAESDIVQLMQSNQLPDYNALVTVQGTGLLDLATFGVSDTIGTADGVVALQVNDGTVKTGAGTLTINGNIATLANVAATGLPGSGVFRAPIISGKLNLGDNFLRIIDVTDRAELLVDVIISADLSGAADMQKQTAGNLLLSGNNAGLTGNWFLSGNPGNNQPGITFGSANPLGSGIVYPANTMQIAADGGPRTIANRFIMQDLRLAGGNDLKIQGTIDLVVGINLTVFNAVTLEAAGGIGELSSGAVLNKAGAGFLNISAPAYFSGALTVNAAGGQVRLSDTGKLPNIPSITVNLGGTFTVDNRASADSDRVRNTATVDLRGGTIELFGNSSTPINEVLHTLSTSTTLATSSVASHSQGTPTKFSFGSFAPAANTFVIFNGASSNAADTLGTTNNQILFFNPPTNLLLNGIIPIAAIVNSPTDIDFAGYNALTGITPPPTINTLAGATATDNVKLTGAGPFTVASPTNVNAVLIVGNGIGVSGVGPLNVVSGLLLNIGGSNTISAPLAFGGARGTVHTFGNVNTISLTGAIDGQSGLAKLGQGALLLGGANTYAGTTTIFEGSTRITSSAALGVAANSAASEGTIVQFGAALEIDGSAGAVNVGEEALTLNGLGFGYGNQTTIVSGNTGALRNISGANTWGGVVTLPGTASLTHVIGVDAGSLAFTGNSVLTGGVNTANLNKVGAGILELGGAAANNIALASLGVLEGTLRLNKTAGLAAIPATVVAVAIGDNIGGDDADQLLWAAGDQIADVTTAITVQSSGKADLTNFNETVGGTLTVINGFGMVNSTTGISADVVTGTGTFTVASGITASNQTGTLGGATPATIAGTIALQAVGGAGAIRTWTTNDSVANTDLLVTAKITDGDGNANLQGITTAGVGRLELDPTAASDFSGVFTVGAGRTRISNANSFGANALGFGGAGANTAVGSGFTLELNGVTITDEVLSINGTGFGGRGALVGVPNSGTSVWQQTAFVGQLVTMAGAATIGVDTGATIDLAASANVSALLTKLLPGTLRLSGGLANIGTGGLTVVEGSVRLAKGSGVDALAGGALTIGNEFGGQDVDQVIWENSDQLNPLVTITVFASGLLDLQTNAESIANAGTVLTMQFDPDYRAHVRSTGAGSLNLTGPNDTSTIVVVTGAQAAAMVATSPGAWIEGNLDLGGSRRQLNIADQACRKQSWKLLH